MKFDDDVSELEKPGLLKKNLIERYYIFQPLEKKDIYFNTWGKNKKEKKKTQ